MKISIKFDANDQKEVAAVFSKLTGLVRQGIKTDDIMAHLDKVAVVLGLLPDDVTKSDGDGETPVAENVRVVPDVGAIKTGDVSLQTLTALNSAGIDNVYWLSEYSEAQLKRLKGMDDVGVGECRGLLEHYGRKLRFE